MSNLAKGIGITLIAFAVIGFCAIVISDPSEERRAFPFHSSLPVAVKKFTTVTFALEPGYHYQIEISLATSVPYADCLLGAGTGALSGNCKHHPSTLDLGWSLLDERGQIVASGVSQGDEATFGYGGDGVDVVVGYINISRSMNARLTLHYRRSALALASLQPSLLVHDPLAQEGNGINEALLGLLGIVVGITGGALLLISRRRSLENPA